jgi:hypothetical protein
MVQSPCPDWLSKPRLINAVAAGRRLLILICCAAASRPPKPRDSADLPANKPTDASGVLSTSHLFNSLMPGRERDDNDLGPQGGRQGPRE